MDKRKIVIWILIVIAVLSFLWFNPLGIKLGYMINGGKSSDASIQEVSPDTLLHEYYYQINTYDRYRNSDNPTAQKWAETAKQKANELADKYNELVGEFVLNGA